MSDKNRNDILEEQKRARQEFLELKKMQKGEMEAPPKPSEVAIIPKTPKEKWDNFWFQYKWHVIIITAMAAILAVLITQCATRTKYDYEVVYFAYTAALDDQAAKISEYLKPYAKDLNGDGEINIQVINCSFSADSPDTQYRYTVMTKLQALIAGDENAILFITDEGGRKYLDGLSEGDGLLEKDPYKFEEGFYKSTEFEGIGKLPEGLEITTRRISDTVLEKKDGARDTYEGAQKLLKALKENKRK